MIMLDNRQFFSEVFKSGQETLYKDLISIGYIRYPDELYRYDRWLRLYTPHIRRMQGKYDFAREFDGVKYNN